MGVFRAPIDGFYSSARESINRNAELVIRYPAQDEPRRYSTLLWLTVMCGAAQLDHVVRRKAWRNTVLETVEPRSENAGYTSGRHPVMNSSTNSRHLKLLHQ
jgi:hypothetical protein